MQVGHQYENRHGVYTVLRVVDGIVTLQYEGSQGVASGSVEVLSGIHSNIQAERARELVARAQNETDDSFIEALRLAGCNISVRIHPNGFAKFASRYLGVTGEAITEETPEVFLCDSYFPNAGMGVRFNVHIVVPAKFHVTLLRHQQQVSHSKFVWKLLERGFRLGGNAPGSVSSTQ